MNNIKSFNEYTHQELEVIAYDNVLNEGLRSFFNKRAAAKVRSELADEIEMSKSIMEGIQTGLDSLNENFDAIKKEIEDTDNEQIKGKKQETLDAIIKILEDSRKNTWDLNQLIDEGEIDYTGFTANVGIASVAYFGILLTPFRATILMHKGYKYFFNIIKNTIRKALVMLQLNFDQFENLIITKGFQSMDYLQSDDSAAKVSEFYGSINSQLFGERGSLSGKRGSKELELKLKAAKQQFDQQMKLDKQAQQADNAYNCLDMYNNTYTKSLETLRSYSQDDVQKNLDSIKTSMSKLAGQDVDLQTYSELLIAAAEEHAYAVSSSIYNKFAKMTEVFSLPNQKKMIDLIMDANKEHQKEAKRLMKERKANKDLQERIETNSKKETDGLEVFKSLEGVDIGDIEEGEEGLKKYDTSKIKADKWTYSEFTKLKDTDQESLEIWLELHPEVLKKCDESLQVYIDTPLNNSSYIDSLIDYIAPCISNNENVEESVILSFDEYIFESKKKKKKHHSSSRSYIPEPEETESPKYELSDKEKKRLDKKIETVKAKLTDLMTLALGKDYMDKEEFTDEDKVKLDYIIEKCKEKEFDDGVIDELKSYRKGIETRYELFIDFKNIDNAQINDLKELYSNEEVAVAALKAIGKKVLKDNTFVKNSKYIVGRIQKCFDKRKAGISIMSSIVLANSIKKLSELRNNDYSQVENNTKKSEE